MLYETVYPLIDTVGNRNIRCHRSYVAAVTSIQNDMPDVWRQIQEVVINSNSRYTEYVVFLTQDENHLQPTPLKDKFDPRLKVKHVTDSGPSIDDDLKYTYETVFAVFTK